MKLKSIQVLAATALLFAATWAQAAITCSIDQPSPGFSSAYVPSNPGTNITQTSFTVTCTRGLVTDATTVNYSIATNNGLNPGGGSNNAAFGGNLIKYDTYRDSGCSLRWKGGGNVFTLSMTLGAVGVPTSVQTTYWGCIPAGQTGLPAGTYTDTVTMTLTAAGTTIVGAPFTFPVSIFTPSVCTITSAPGNIVFAYTAFQAAPATANTTFGATCTNLLPYTMALNATSGVVSGLQYLLALSAASSTGTGFQQTHSINGTMPASQAGTCATGSCSATNIHTLTITY